MIAWRFRGGAGLVDARAWTGDSCLGIGAVGCDRNEIDDARTRGRGGILEMPLPPCSDQRASPVRRTRRRLAQRGAFTLLEATVVLAITGILLALAVPRFRELRDASAVQGAMAELGGQFALARQTAVARRTMAAVVLDTATGTVEVRAGG